MSRFWVGNGGSWSEVAHWSTTSGGTGGSAVPTATDDVFFDANSFTSAAQTVLLASGTIHYCKSLSFTGTLFSPTLNWTGATIQCYGNFTLIEAMTVTTSSGFPYSTLTLFGTGTGNILNLADQVTNLNVLFKQDGTYTLGSKMLVRSFTVNPTLTTELPVLVTNNYNVVCSFGGVAVGRLDCGSSTFTFTSDSGIWSLVSGDSTFNAQTSTFIFPNATDIDDNAAPGDFTYNHVKITNTAATVSMGITNMTTLTIDPGVHVEFWNATDNPGWLYTIGTLNAYGSAASLITFSSDVTPNQYELDATTANVGYVDVHDCIAGGAASPFIDIGGVDSGNNTDWTFTSVSSQNTALGSEALYSNASASDNVAIGYRSLYTNADGDFNTAIGSGAMRLGTDFENSVAIGYEALLHGGGGSDVAIGKFALNLSTTGTSNIAIGPAALLNNVSGGSNIAIGMQALSFNNIGGGAGGESNLGIGPQSLSSLNSGSNNTALGSSTGYSLVTGSGNVFLGYYAGGGVGTGISNRLYIANTGTETPLIYGLFTGTGAGLTIHSQATDGIPLIVKGILSQASNLQQWQTSVAGVLASVSNTGVITAPNFVSSVAIGTSPYAATSTTLNTNLNADLIDSVHVASLTDARLLRYESTGTQIENATVTETSGALGGITTLSMNNQLTNTLAIGTAPFVVTSTTLNTNLNADMVDSVHVAALTDARLVRYESTGTQLENATVTETAGALGGITTLAMSGQLTNTLAIGTSPFAITSTTVNTNLNADLLDGVHESVFSLIDGTRAFTGVVSGVFPTASSHLVTKEYVDQAISFISEYFFNNTASSIGGIYYKMLESLTGEAESTFTSGSLGAGNDQALFNFATDANIPGAVTLQSGVYPAHIHAEKTAGTKPAKIYFIIYTRATDTTETPRATSETSDYITTKTAIDLHATVTSDVTIAATDRIIIKWFANVGATGSDATIALYAEGVDASSLAVPTSVEVLNSVFVRKDGTQALTADWDAGSFEIRAQTFESDVATSTAPLIVASTTVVTNLNADLLDGQHGSYFLDSANFTGTNWTDLTDGGATTLHSHAGSVPTTITVANEATDTSCFPLFVTTDTGDLGPKTVATLTLNSNTGAVGVGSLVSGGAISGTTINGTIITATTQLISDKSTDTAASAPLIDMRRSRDGNPTDDVSDNDYLGEIRFRGYRTAGYYEGAIIRAVVNGTPGVDDMPTELIFATSADGSATPTTRLTIDAAGLATFAGNITSANLTAANITDLTDGGATTLHSHAGGGGATVLEVQVFS